MMKPSEDLKSGVIRILEDYKATDIREYDISERTALADWFVIATGEADRHIEAMAEGLRMAFKDAPGRAREGSGESGWLLVDLGDVIVHLFTVAQRQYYDLDQLWLAVAQGRLPE